MWPGSLSRMATEPRQKRRPSRKISPKTRNRRGSEPGPKQESNAMNTTQKPKRSERRRQGARAAAIGMPSNDRVGAASRRQGDDQTRGQGERGLQTLQEAVTVVLSSPSLLDGYHGASDARHLESYSKSITTAAELRAGRVMVQCTHATRPLLHRAGWKRTELMNHYEVSVIRDRFERLQLAPIRAKGGQR